VAVVPVGVEDVLVDGVALLRVDLLALSPRGQEETAMKKVSGPQVVTSAEASEMPLPAAIQEGLGELVGAAREGLLALSVGLGLSVVHELMEAEFDEVVGSKGKCNRDRTAKRHGHGRGSMTLGGRRVEVSRPRMRTADDERELPVQSYEYFADRDPLLSAPNLPRSGGRSFTSSIVSVPRGERQAWELHPRRLVPGLHGF
jgi:hypothetical protein